MGIGDKIKKIRLQLKLTQKEFGDKLNLDQSYIAQIEGGFKKPRFTLIKEICDVYHIDPRELISSGQTAKNEVQQAITLLLNMTDKDQGITSKIIELLNQMPPETKREILRHAEKAELWTHTKSARKKKSG